MQTLDGIDRPNLLEPDQDYLEVKGTEAATLHLRHDVASISPTKTVINTLTTAYVFNASAILLLEPIASSIYRDPMGLKALLKPPLTLLMQPSGSIIYPAIKPSKQPLRWGGDKP